MTKTKKTGIVIAIVLCAVALVVGCLLFYQAQPVSLGKQLPKKEWGILELELLRPMEPENVRFGEPPMEDILYQLQILQVLPDEENPLPQDDHFRITLYTDDAWPAVLYVKSNGQVHICGNMQYDNWEYYKGAESLYVYLDNLSQTLSPMPWVVIPD